MCSGASISLILRDFFIVFFLENHIHIQDIQEMDFPSPTNLDGGCYEHLDIPSM